MLVFVSDVHLTEPHTKKYEVFLSLLEKFKSDDKMTELFLCGDVFDLWLGHKSYFFKKHEKLIGLLIEIGKTKKVHLFEGNHDFGFSKKWWNEKSIMVHKENYQFVHDGKKIYVCHGDLLNKEDYSYRLLRWFFRSYVAKILIFLIPGLILNIIGNLLSSTDSKSLKTFNSTDKEKFLEEWSIWIKKFSEENDVDVFICGHYHVRLNQKVNGIETFNLGSWLGEKYKYLAYSLKGSDFVEIEPL